MTAFTVLANAPAVAVQLLFWGTLVYICIRLGLAYFYVDRYAAHAIEPVLKRFLLFHQGSLMLALFLLGGACIGYRPSWLPESAGQLLLILACLMIIPVAHIDRSIEDIEEILESRYASIHAPDKE